jgi:hypothetical protein
MMLRTPTTTFFPFRFSTLLTRRPSLSQFFICQLPILFTLLSHMNTHSNTGSSTIPNSQEVHAVRGLLLLQNEAYSAHTFNCTGASSTSQQTESSLVTPARRGIPLEPIADEIASSPLSYSVKSPERTVQQHHSFEETPLIKNTKRQVSCHALTHAQKRRIAMNKAIALERRRLFNSNNKLSPTSSPRKSSLPSFNPSDVNQPSSDASQSTVSSPFIFTLSQQDDLIACFLEDEEKNRRCSLCGLSIHDQKNPYKVMKSICRQSGRECDNITSMSV